MSRSRRFETREPDNDVGPGAYEKQSSFGTSGVSISRSRRGPNVRDEEVPGPGAYQVQTSRLNLRPHTQSATFGSARRKTDLSRIDEDVPGPGAYQVDRSVSALNKHAPSATFGQGHRSISASHMDPSRRGNRDEADEPGPGSYNANLSSFSPRGAVIGRSYRKQVHDDPTPGPGAYEPQWGLVK